MKKWLIGSFFIESLSNSWYDPEDHFEDIIDMVSIGSWAEREIDNIKLTEKRVKSSNKKWLSKK